ncbi:MAG: DNA internalization-related competence protein ComEC/Rec2 [Duganella sp.]
MRTAVIGFACGVGWLQTRAVLPGALATLAALLTMIAILAATVLCRSGLRGRWRLRWLAVYMRPLRRFHFMACMRLTIVWLGGAAAGFLWAAWLAQRALAPALDPADQGRDFIVVGTIDNLPYRFAQGVRFNFAVERVERGDGTVITPSPVPPLVALSWYSGFRGQTSVVGDVQPGERWRLTARLQRPHGNANPYGFDYEAWLLGQGVRATGYVRAAPGNARLDSFVVSFNNLVERGRAGLRARILAALAGRQYAGVIVALVVGDQRGIDQQDWQVFTRTGIGHLISISGLHITMVAGLVALLVFTLWRHSFFTRAQLPLLLPAQKVAALAGAGAALLYVLLAGFGVPAQRTLYMLLVVAAALWLNRLSGMSHVLCAALGVVLLRDPWAVLWPGFWLSFAAVAVILYATTGRVVARTAAPLQSDQNLDGETATSPGWPARLAAWRASLRNALRLGALTQYAVTLGLLPLTMLLFAQVSLISPMANAVAIPLISLLVTPLALVGSLLPAPLASPLLQLAHALVLGLAVCLEWFSGLRYAVWSAPLPPWWLFGWAMFGTLWLLAPRGWPVRWLGLATWIPVLAAQPSHPPPGRVTVTAFDVGQGMALLVETSGHRLLYDTGPSYGADANSNPSANAGSRVLLPYLRARGIAALDGVVVSHSDTDHVGGALTVLQGVRVGWLLSSLPARHPVALAAARRLSCMAGQRWSWDGVHFEVLHPLAASYADASLKPNNRSCVLRITAGDRSLLLAGDIEAAQEAQLLDRSPQALRADVLLAPHHGSGTSSTSGFLQAVRPQVAIFQVGHRNRYQHPKGEVYQRYGELGIERLRTDRDGAITVEMGMDLHIQRYRHTDARYWHER